MDNVSKAFEPKIAGGPGMLLVKNSTGSIQLEVKHLVSILNQAVGRGFMRVIDQDSFGQARYFAIYEDDGYLTISVTANPEAQQ